MYSGLQRTSSRMQTPQLLTIFYPHLFPLYMTGQIHVALFIFRKKKDVLIVSQSLTEDRLSDFLTQR